MALAIKSFQRTNLINSMLPEHLLLQGGRRRYEMDTEGFHCGENCQKCWKQEKATSQILKIKQSSKVYKPEKGV